MTERDIVANILVWNNISFTNLVRVRNPEDNLDAGDVKHICRGGIGLMTQQRFNSPVPIEGKPEQIDLIFWACPHCGKVYYHLERERIPVY